ncbi:MAG: tRNA (guanine-N7-)-methyltransferase [Bradymonadia bacterium]
MERFREFIAAPGPVGVEVGFDFGHRILDHATRWPEVRWIGIEVRKARVEQLAERAPANLLAWRADARTVFNQLMPAGRLSQVDIMFPTPWWDENKRAKRLLITPQFVGDLVTSLAADGVVHFATDVPGYSVHAEQVFAGWTLTEPGLSGEGLSRRQNVCARDSIPVHHAWFGRPGDDFP